VVERQAEIDRRNAAFWDALCGSGLAQQLGITERSPESLARFDAAYLEMYPYLDGYLPTAAHRAASVLEVGLGYGTVSQILTARGLDYHGLDIASAPVEMVRYRLERLGVDDPEERVRVGSVLDMDHPDDSFDHVVTIGCLHHTGDIPRAVGEVERVLRPGGRALVMLYNSRSFRRIGMALRSLPRRIGGEGADDEELRGAYDRNLEGEAAPTTDYISAREARRLFAGFAQVNVRRENFDPIVFRGRAIDRERLLGWPARVAGLDLYITAVK
jgi:SAM-dependent methyltransferase